MELQQGGGIRIMCKNIYWNVIAAAYLSRTVERYAGREACLYVNLYIAGTGLEKRYAGSERVQELTASLFLGGSQGEPREEPAGVRRCAAGQGAQLCCDSFGLRAPAKKVRRQTMPAMYVFIHCGHRRFNRPTRRSGARARAEHQFFGGAQGEPRDHPAGVRRSAAGQGT